VATNNDLVLVDQVLAERQAARAEPLPDDYAFELFASEQVLRDRELSSDEVEAGVVGGGNDGGLDGVYVFLGDVLLADDSEVLEESFSASKISVGTPLTLVLVQAKRTESFAETAIDVVADSTRRLLDLTEPVDDLRTLYSEALVGAVGRFRIAVQRLATRHPKLRIEFHYVTRGSSANANTKVLAKAKDLEQQFEGSFSDAAGQVALIGATELWKLTSSTPTYTLSLTYRENATSGSSHVALVSIRDYLDFLRDESGALRRHIFDWNVRDYQGEVEVNREMQESLANAADPDFWWLNNGVTIICSKTSIVGKTYSLDDVQIVNGLQTSHSIYRALASAPDDHAALDDSVLVRILVTDDPTTRDKVIRATNRQTSVPAASLRATDDIQRAIETFFFGHGWFYDRRKNYYRNIGKNPERIVSIPLLAQAVMAMGLGQANNSRARPSSLLKNDDDYGKIFSEKFPLDVYLWMAKTQRDVDNFLLAPEAATTAPERNNLRFHLAMLCVARRFGGRVYSPAQLAKLAQDDATLDSAELTDGLSDLRQWYEDHTGLTGDSMDKAAKSNDFVEYVFTKAFP
jgi:hypothetical protein